jgi:hypothetical protein
MWHLITYLLAVTEMGLSGEASAGKTLKVKFTGLIQYSQVDPAV